MAGHSFVAIAYILILFRSVILKHGLVLKVQCLYGVRKYDEDPA